MKTAICLYGIHHQDAYKHWMGWSINVDYRKSIESFKIHIETYLKSISDVDYYFSTYQSSIQDQLLNDFKPKRLLFNEFINGDKINDYSNLKKQRMIESLDLAGEEYDYYFICRFDLMFKKSLGELNVDLNKINLNCRMKPFYGENDVDDNLFFFPKSQLSHFVNSVKSHDSSKFMHDILNHMDESNVNFLLQEKVFSHEMSFYQICR